MSKLLRQNVGGTDFTMVGCALTGVCASAASDYVKAVTLSDGDELSDGMTVIVAFANGNTAGTAPAPTTIYSSDQVNYYSDAGLTVPFTLAPSGCYTIEYTGTGNAYTYISYPIMQVGSVSGPLCDASGNKASGALWFAGDKVSVLYTNGCFNVIPQSSSLMTVTAASSVVNGAPVRVGSTVRIMFTADIAGVNASTVLTLKYNGVDIPVRVGKNGALADFNAYEVSSGVYKYLQAYTTLEMMFDGTQFIIIGNPVVLSSADYTIYPDGKINYSKNTVTITSNGAGVASSAIDLFIARGVSTSTHQVFIIGIQDRNDGSKTASMILDLHYSVSVNIMTLVNNGLSISGANPIGTIGVDGGSGTYDFTFTLLT